MGRWQRLRNAAPERVSESDADAISQHDVVREGDATTAINPSPCRIHATEAATPKNTYFNPFMSAGALGVWIDDFNSDDPEFAQLDFIGGGSSRRRDVSPRWLVQGSQAMPISRM